MPRTDVPITPTVLRWAMDEAGITDSALAERVGVSVETIRTWLAGTAQPALTKFRKMASVLRRPLATFLLPRPPQSVPLRVAFRRAPSDDRDELLPKERRYLREARWVQQTLSWLLAQHAGGSAALPKYREGASVADVAKSARELLGLTDDSHVAWRTEHDAQRAWRNAYEVAGVFVFLLPLGAESCRGFSLWDDHAPLIAVNTRWNPQARIFSMAHEFAHLLTRTDSACTDQASGLGRDGSDPLERWCERVAARMLMPEPPLRALLQRMPGADDTATATLTTASTVARRFKVSLRAATIRLIELGVADWDLFRSLPEGGDRKSEGGGGGGRDRIQIRLDEYGHRAAAVFVSGLQRETIDRSDVLDYLRVADPELDRLSATLGDTSA